MADVQQPGTSQPTEEQPTQNEGQAAQGKGRKRKLSAKRPNANKKGGPTEEEIDTEKLRFLLDPVLEALRGIQNRNEAETMKNSRQYSATISDGN